MESILLYRSLLKRAVETGRRVKQDLGISPSPVLSHLYHVIEKGLIRSLYETALTAPVERPLPNHVVCVTFAVMKIGEGMGYEMAKLMKLGLAAFYQNVGMYKMPLNLLCGDDKTDDRGLARARHYPKASAQILKKLGSQYEWLVTVAGQVKERRDGSGYPKGLSHGAISEMASLIGLVDTYMALIRKGPYRRELLPKDISRFIFDHGETWFSKPIQKAFLAHIELFPPHTCVRLNNKSLGRIVTVDKQSPLRPTIELLYDGTGQRLEKGQTIRLSEHRALRILTAIDGQALS
jgi:HD-GYP domain-containing protein (c-di-GMP phosphodiesterase class II)